MKYHDNQVRLYTNYMDEGNERRWDLENGAFKISTLSVIDGQDPDGLNTIDQVKTWTMNDGHITFRVGRKGSDTVAESWKESIKSSENTFNDNPKDLNFAFIGEMRLYMNNNTHQYRFILPDVGLARGHARDNSVWWFGAKDAEYQEDWENLVLIKGHREHLDGRLFDEEWFFFFKRGPLKLSGSDVDLVVLEKVELNKNL